jgi:hypothetical protein
VNVDEGIWAPHADGTDVNSVDRDLKLGVLATGDDKGRIKLFRYTPRGGAQSWDRRERGEEGEERETHAAVKPSTCLTLGVVLPVSMAMPHPLSAPMETCEK